MCAATPPASAAAAGAVEPAGSTTWLVAFRGEDGRPLARGWRLAPAGYGSLSTPNGDALRADPRGECDRMQRVRR